MITQTRNLYSLSNDIDFNLEELLPIKLPSRVLLCTPEYFNVSDPKNAHMKNGDTIDKQLATEQWNNLKKIYLNLAEKKVINSLKIINGWKDCEDMVFCANQTFTWIKDDKKFAVMANMKHSSRQKEVLYFEQFFTGMGYEICKLKPGIFFEAMGDAIPLPGKQLIFLGHGFRSSVNAAKELGKLLDVKVVTLKLVNELFYHLDTCFIPLNCHTTLIVKEAFDTDSFNVIKCLFKEVIEIPNIEALNFSLNAHCFYTNQGNKIAIIHKGSPITVSILKENNYTVYEINTSEFMKSGGSVFCMKLAYY